MAAETANYPKQLNPTAPSGQDDPREGDDHIRLIKKVLSHTFPNFASPITASSADLNQLDGKTLGSAAFKNAPFSGDFGSASGKDAPFSGNFTEVAGKSAPFTGNFGTAAEKDVGTFGPRVPLLDAQNRWDANQYTKDPALWGVNNVNNLLVAKMQVLNGGGYIQLDKFNDETTITLRGDTGQIRCKSLVVEESTPSTSLLAPNYTSPNVSYQKGNTVTLSHGLGREPHLIRAVLRCTSSNSGYSVGEEVELGSAADYGSDRGVVISTSSSQIFINFGANDPTLLHKNIHNSDVLNTNSWVVRVYAW